MRKIAVALLALALLLPLVACGERDDSEAVLRAKLEAKITQQILAFEYDDFDGDGVFEAFAFVGTEPDEGNGHAGEIWFVNARGAERIDEDRPYGGTWYAGLIEIYTFGRRKFVKVEDCYATGGLVNLWSVRGGEPYLESVSGVGSALEKLDENNLLLYHSTLDAIYDYSNGTGLGRTIKPYWFYWDGERFREYGGMPITMAEEEKLRKLDGAAEILDSIQGLTHAGYYRGNGIINIVYGVPEDEFETNCYYITLQLDDNKVTVVEEGSGVYLYALVPHIAVQSELPEIFN